MRQQLLRLLAAIRDRERELDEIADAIEHLFRKGVMPPPPDDTGTPLPRPSA